MEAASGSRATRRSTSSKSCDRKFRLQRRLQTAVTDGGYRWPLQTVVTDGGYRRPLRAHLPQRQGLGEELPLHPLHPLHYLPQPQGLGEELPLKREAEADGRGLLHTRLACTRLEGA